MDGKVRKFVVQVPGEINYLSRFREFVVGVAEESGITQQDIDDIELAVDEACANVIEHAYPRDHDNKDMMIQMEIDASRLVITLIDKGKPFNYLRFNPRNINELTEKGADGGLGIRLIFTIMDEVESTRTAEGYNKLIMTKYFQSANAN